MKQLQLDYVSDLHLSFYLNFNRGKYSKEQMEQLITSKIVPQIKGRILVVAGDISEFINAGIDFLNLCSKYYEKVFFVAGNHEYYLSNFISSSMKEKFNSESLNKVEEIKRLSANNDKLVFLDRNADNKGIAHFDNFKIAGDTLWYIPVGVKGWAFYRLLSNDSRMILSKESKKGRIISLHNSSMSWYESLPDDLDLIITHVPPIKTKKGSSCYYCEVDTFKAPIWIYGHDHIEEDLLLGKTRFVSNPWGYESKDLKIKTLTLRKKVKI